MPHATIGKTPARKPGRHFFANPGPTNIPDSVLRAMDRNSMDFMESDFLEIYDQARAGLKRILFTDHEVFFYASSGHGGWEATMVNLFSAGDKVLMIGGGYFPSTWAALSRAYGIEVEMLEVDWHEGVKIADLQARLEADKAHQIKAVCVVHNETSTSVALPLREIRAAIDAARHPALYLCDTISSLGCFAFKMDEWGIDVVVGGSQKGLMLPTGMAFSAVGPKAMAAHEKATLPRFYFDWTAMLSRRFRSFTGSVPSCLSSAWRKWLQAAGAGRHRKCLGAPSSPRRRRCVPQDGSGAVAIRARRFIAAMQSRYSDSVTTFEAPEGHDAERLRKVLLDRYNVSTGGGLGALSGRVFRIGHMGDLNEAMILGTLATVEVAMGEVGMPHTKGGVMAAMEALSK